MARGGIEAHGAEVLRTARQAALRVTEWRLTQPGSQGLLQMLDNMREVDVVCVQSPLDPAGRRVLFRGAAAVLANSGHEPFGLVGLETMAVGGLACTGATGEEYVLAGQNALMLETANPQEFVSLFAALRTEPARERALRHAGRVTAQRYAWAQILHGILLPRLHLLTGIPTGIALAGKSSHVSRRLTAMDVRQVASERACSSAERHTKESAHEKSLCQDWSHLPCDLRTAT